MAKKKQVLPRKTEDAAANDPYKLKIKAVDDLVSANEENSPPVPKKELRKYHAGPRVRLADWIKAALLKAWIAGVVCYFFLWGLGRYLADQLDTLVVLAIALGVLTDLITNNVFRFIAKTPGAYDRFMTFPRKGFVSLPLNVVYSALLVLCVVTTYSAVNALASSQGGEGETAFLGVEPILFGVLTAAWDAVFLAMKRVARKMVEDAKKSVGKR